MKRARNTFLIPYTRTNGSSATNKETITAKFVWRVQLPFSLFETKNMKVVAGQKSTKTDRRTVDSNVSYQENYRTGNQNTDLNGIDYNIVVNSATSFGEKPLGI